VNPASNPWPVVELRQYTLHPGRRDDLVELFEREFVETQEACGMRLFGQFRDLDDTDRFVWLRGFAGMDARAAALGAFYGGPVWKAHRDAANATMIDSDDVLLLRLANGSSFPATLPSPVLHVTVSHSCLLTVDGSQATGRQPSTILTLLETEPSENTYPALPVRTGEHLFVALGAAPAAVASPLQRLRLEPTRRSAMYFSPA